jgi:hypothetical protein
MHQIKLFNNVRHLRALISRAKLQGEQIGYSRARKEFTAQEKIFLNQENIRIKNLMQAQTKDLANSELAYKEKLRLNDQITKTAIDKAVQDVANAKAMEDYWREQIVTVKNFLAEAQVTIKEANSKTEQVQKEMSRADVSNGNIKRLMNKFDKLVANAEIPK